MSDILFTNAYFLYLDPKQQKAGNAYPPLGTLYAASHLRENGYKVNLFDTMLVDSPLEIETTLLNEKPDFLVIYDDGFNYLTKMCLSNMREAAFTMISLAKKHHCKVLVSSSDSTDHYELYLNKGSDFVILGEGEITLNELIGCLRDNKDYSNIQGIAYKENSHVVNKGKRSVMRDLDQLPLPAWDLVDIEKYKKLWLKTHGYFSLNAVTSRGCTYKCNWCAKPIFGNRYHARTPENMVQELKLLIKSFGATQIWFSDDIFGLKPGWIKQFADLVEKEGLKFRFKIQSRADLLLEEEIVRDLARAGCDEIWIGAESGSQKILDAMDKGTTIDQIYKSRKLMRKHGIRTAFFLQFGYPGENHEDVEATIKMLLELMPDDIGISVTYPLPGTKLYEKVKPELKEKTNWTDSDELAMMFHNTYPKNYYKELQRYVHKVYRYNKSIIEVGRQLQNPSTLEPKTIRKAMSIPYNFTASLYYKTRLSRLRNSL